MNLIHSIVLISILVMTMSHRVLGWTMESHPNGNRRAFLTTSIATIGSTVASSFLCPTDPVSARGLGSKDSVVQREINTFNSLIYNFNNTALDGGLDASTLNEPSISFVDFGEAMKKGEVKFVEFMAPSGLIAYVTLKKNPKKPIRIGQGYPTGAKNSWSSPDFVIRSVSNYGVPYKFTVPALAKYKRS
jgi:hypothetical protein